MDRLPSAFEEWHAVELPVVDGQGRLLGAVRRSDFVRARGLPSHPASLHKPQRVAEVLDSAVRIHESSSIAQAVQIFASKRARTLILVQDDDTVAGVLTDLDLLRWVTQARRRLSELTEVRP